MKNHQNIKLEWVTTHENLAVCCDSIRRASRIGVDTEFMRSNTFYPIPALFQLVTEDCVYLVDPTSIKDFSCLKQVLESKDIIKVMHAIGEDVDLFRQTLGINLECVFDTQIAAGLCNKGVNVGYSGLVQHLLDIDIPKSETRSDWLQRPLSEAQVHYAVEDVIHLFAMYDVLMKELMQRDLLDAVYEETGRLVENGRHENIDKYYLKLRGGWKLPEKNQRILQALAGWRENTARKRNIPRNRVIADKVLVEIASRLPDSLDRLRRIPEIKHGAVKKDGKIILSLIKDGATKLAEQNKTFERIRGPLSSDLQKLYKQIKANIQEVAEQADVPIEMLINKKMLEKVIYLSAQRGEPDLSMVELNGWRNKYIQQPILSVLGAS